MKLRDLNTNIRTDLFEYLCNLEDINKYKFVNYLDIITTDFVENSEDGINELLEGFEPSDILRIEDRTERRNTLATKCGDTLYSCDFGDIINYNDLEEKLLDTEVEDIQYVLDYIDSDYTLFKEDKLYDTLGKICDDIRYSINSLIKYKDTPKVNEFITDLDNTKIKIKKAIDKYNSRDISLT